MEIARRLPIVLLGAAVSGCASSPDPLLCATVGGLLGGGGGAYAGSETPGRDGDEMIAYGAGGLLVGAGAGYLLCKLLEEEPAPAPAPPPPQAKPAPPPAPAVDRCAEVIRLRGVNFDFDRDDIRPDAEPILDEAATLLADALRDCPGNRVSVEGHTDAVGTDAYNQGLSERRARSVTESLVSRGVPASQLSPQGFGETNPIATNDTAEGRALNRRVELRLVR